MTKVTYSNIELKNMYKEYLAIKGFLDIEKMDYGAFIENFIEWAELNGYIQIFIDDRVEWEKQIGETK